jgi:hypothetical protein
MAMQIFLTLILFGIAIAGFIVLRWMSHRD